MAKPTGIVIKGVNQTMKKLKVFWARFKETARKCGLFVLAHKKIIIAILVALALFSAGWFANKYLNPRIVERPVPVTVEKRVEVPIEIPVAAKGDTEIRYVEKESPTDADVAIQQEKPQISMQYNDKLYRIDTLQNEEQKFEKGKLDIKQSSTATLDVTPIVKREVSVALDEQSKKLNEEFHKDMKKEKRESAVKGFLAGAALATAVSIVK